MKLNKAGWKPAWLTEDLLLKLRSKREMHNKWKQEHVNRGEYRDMVEMSKGKPSKIRNRTWQGTWRITRRDPVHSQVRKESLRRAYARICKQVEWVMTDTVKTEVPSDPFALIFTWQSNLPVLSRRQSSKWVWGQRSKEQVWDHLMKLNSL